MALFDGNKEEDETGFHINNYLDLILFDVLIKALDNNNDCLLMSFSSLFVDNEEVSTNKDEIKFTLFYGSSYKGHGSLDINFKSISNEVSQLEKIFTYAKVESYIGYN